MRHVPLLLACLIPFAACAPSRAALFDPVRDAIRDRTRVAPEWRAGATRSAAAEARVRELLASPLTADGAAEIAILGNAELQGTFEDLALAGAAATEARLPPNPHAELELRFPLDGGETQIELAAVQSLTGLLAIVPRARAGETRLRAVRRETVAAAVDLAGRARVAFFRAAAAERTLALRRTIAEAASASAALAHSLHEAGNITDLALTREEVFEEEAKLAVAAGEAEAAVARRELEAILALADGEAAAIAPLPDPPGGAPATSDLERVAVSTSLELEALRLRIHAVGDDICVARLTSFLPDLGVGVAAKREHDWSVGPIFSLSLPIFDWGTARRAAAWSGLRKAQQEYAALTVELRATARVTAVGLETAYDRAHRMKTVVLPLRERLVAQSLLQYNAMNLSPFELLAVRREHVHAEEMYVEAVRDYWIAATEADQLRAGSLPSRGSPHTRSDR